MRLRSLIVPLGLTATLSGCVTTHFHERERLVDRAALFDQDHFVLYLRDKIEAAREGSFGGFGGAAAGGCGCE
jgi:hypothetical protein